MSKIIMLISKEFLILISIAFVVAVPVGYYFINKWLQDFAYRINIGWWMFALAGMLADIDRIAHHEFPGNKSSNSKPGKEFENGMKPIQPFQRKALKGLLNYEQL